MALVSIGVIPFIRDIEFSKRQPMVTIRPVFTMVDSMILLWEAVGGGLFEPWSKTVSVFFVFLPGGCGCSCAVRLGVGERGGTVEASRKQVDRGDE